VILFLHGVPETSHIWTKVRTLIDRPSVAPDLPGFGCARPDGFAATKDAYVDWVLGEIERIGEPVDLVGHDWGAGITYGVVTQHPDANVRSWVADVGAIAHPEYEWHDFAKIWQTPGDGEAWVTSTAATSAPDRAVLYEALGIPSEDALAMATSFDEVMGGAILDLYRSATPNPHAHWGPWSPTKATGLVLHPSADPFDDLARSQEVAAALGARHATIEASHFWGYQAPDQAAAVLTAFWDSLD
jgi:pimeloyl-ACP methyl ester carboxylesterase